MKVPKAICCCLQTGNVIKCHGDNVVHMYTKFHLHAAIIRGVKMLCFNEHCICCCCCLQTCRCHGDGVINVCTEFHFHACYTEKDIGAKYFL